MFRRVFAALLFALIAGGSVALAQKKGPNGGDVVIAEGHPIEFVTSEQEIMFYLTDDDGSPLASKNMAGRAVVQDGGKTITVKLSPAEPNKLVGKLAAPLGTKARVVLSATFSAGGHKHMLQARFTVN
jgi:hypothetical protein